MRLFSAEKPFEREKPISKSQWKKKRGRFGQEAQSVLLLQAFEHAPLGAAFR
jgi:hypothetical protein